MTTIDNAIFGILSDLPAFQRANGLPPTGVMLLKIRARTEYRMRKTGNPYRGACVETEYTQWGMCGTNWERCVRNALAKITPEGGVVQEFVASPRQWGTHVAGTPFVTHTPKGENEPVLYWPMVEWVGVKRDPNRVIYVDGAVADGETVAALLPFRIVSSRHTDATTTTGEIVRLPILYRSPMVRNLRALQAGGLIEITGRVVTLTHKGGATETIGLL